MYLKEKVTHYCPTLCDPINYTVHGILQARILEWVAFPFIKQHLSSWALTDTELELTILF